MTAIFVSKTMAYFWRHPVFLVDQGAPVGDQGAPDVAGEVDEGAPVGVKVPAGDLPLSPLLIG